MRNIVILGAGTAGTMMANKLAKKLSQDWQITVIDRDPKHYYQPGFLFLPFGTYRPEAVVKDKVSLLSRRVDFRLAEATKIDPRKNEVHLNIGDRVSYDILVIASGCDIQPGQTEGLQGELWRKKVFDFYTFDGAVSLEKALREFQGGTLVVNVTEMPIKCPVAPIEFAFLADAYFAKRGIRDKVKIKYVTPLPGAFTKEKASKFLGNMFRDRGIEVVTDFSIGCVENAEQKIVSFDETEVKFDLLVSIPTNMGSQVIADSEMGDELNFVPTDKGTLRSEKFENIFVLGDATNVPASKAGSVAHFEADILLESILSTIGGKPLTRKFDGHANCFIESGKGKAILIDFNYAVEPVRGKFPIPGIGPFSLLQETRINHWGKLAFRWMYWNLLIPGKSLPVRSEMSLAGKELETAPGTV